MKIQFVHDGVTYTAEYEKIDGTTWVHFQGRTWSVAGESTSKRKKGRAGGHPQNEITAPMPGKIIKLSVKKGDAVQAGQILVVMEAMKMEYSLKAEVTGVVGEVLVQAAQQVPLGHTLVRLESKGAPS